MPIYPPRNTSTKKSQILDYKVFEFLKSIEKNNSEEKILVKAENVKKAKLNLLKSRISLLKTFKTSGENQEKEKLKEKLHKEIVQWNSISLEEIITFCKN